MPIKGLWIAMLLAAIGLSGCQTWPNGNFPLQNTTRVPPPGTGTYQLPNGYYNNTSGLPTGSGMQTSSNGGLRPATGNFPTTQLAASPTGASNSFAATANPAPANLSQQSSSNANSAQLGSSASASTRVVPASSQSFTAPSAAAPVVSAAYSSQGTSEAEATAPASAKLSDSPSGPELPSLQWQQ